MSNSPVAALRERRRKGALKSDPAQDLAAEKLQLLHQALKNYVPYCVSKAGVVMLTQALAKALAPHVRVNCICPGTILLPSENQGEDTEYSDDEDLLRNRVPLRRFGTPEEIAQSIVFLIGGPQFISGAVLPVDGAELIERCIADCHRVGLFGYLDL